jgi:malonate transporter MadL subunit
MKIYGVAFLTVCYLVGQLIGQYLGIFLGIGGNVGGVDISMLLLVLVNDRFYKTTSMNSETKEGIDRICTWIYGCEKFYYHRGWGVYLHCWTNYRGCYWRFF